MKRPPDSDALTAARSREAAAELLDGLTAKQLREVAEASRVAVGSGDSKARMVDRIVEGTAGVRITSEAMRGPAS